MQAAGISKGSGTPPAGKALILLGNAPNPATPADVNIPTTAFKEIGTVSLKHVYEIAKIKKKDDHLKHVGLEELARSILGTSRNIGIRVIRKRLERIATLQRVVTNHALDSVILPSEDQLVSQASIPIVVPNILCIV